jgi:hypothetical protein
MGITPNYAHIEIPTPNMAAKKTQTLRIKSEMKFLYKKKQQLSLELYHIYTYRMQTHGNTHGPM